MIQGKGATIGNSQEIFISIRVKVQRRKEEKPFLGVLASWRPAILYFVLGLAACIPATLPPQLDDTPGPPVVVTDRTYDAGVFSARYPDGWRVITGEAGRPVSVIFAAPGDDGILIQLSLGTLDAGTFSREGYMTDLRGIDLGSTTVTAIGVAPKDQWETFLPIYERVISSVMMNG